MSPRQAPLQKYYPYLLAGAIVAVSLISYRIYTTPSRSRRLRRSNATRRVSGTRRRQRATIDLDSGGFLTHDQLLQQLNQDGDGSQPGIEIPESVAEALTETGHAAQEARGAGNVGLTVNGRSGRRSSIQESEFSFAAETKESPENQNLLTLLYTIAQDQAQRESYVHRGVTCNNCQIIPIRGIRYRCANCLDYDLCEICEALDSAHPKTHLFYKIRIPAPFIGNPRHAQVPSYPGKPQIMAVSLGPDTLRQLGESTKSVVDQAELEALYEQFKVLAASEYHDTKFGINGAISRDTFDKCFIPNTHLHPPAPNLIYDRMFNFYDSKGDGLVDFEEFAIGVSFTHNKSKTPEKLKRIFKGYDLDNDGYVERKDFLRMFKAFYALSKVLVRDIVASLGDELYEQGHMDQALNGRQPISAVFTSSIPPAQRQWTKPTGEVEDDDDDDDDGEGNNPVVLPSSKDHMDPEDVLSGRYIRSSTPENATDPEGEKQVEDARRFKFWRLHEDDDDNNDNDDDLAIPREENDVGSEVLFHMALRGINELLDLLFAAKERAAVEAKFAAEKTETTTTSGEEEEEGEEKKETSASAAVKEEIKYRGGEGKLSYEEFEKIMTGKSAEKLDFVSTWTDLASF